MSTQGTIESSFTDSPDEILYIVSIRPEPGHEEIFDRWYVEEHLPELLACPGFLAAWRYRIVRADTEGAPEHLAFYRLSGMDAFDSPEYIALRDRSDQQLSPLALEAKAHRELLLNAKYRQTIALSAGTP